MVKYLGAIFGAALGFLITVIWSKIFNTPPLGIAAIFIIGCGYQAYKQIRDDD